MAWRNARSSSTMRTRAVALAGAIETSRFGVLNVPRPSKVEECNTCRHSTIEVLVTESSFSDLHHHTLPDERVLYETAIALAESATLVDATPRMLRAICQALNWEYGALWRVDRAASVLRLVATWHGSSLPFDEFSAASGAQTFTAGVGLPGRCWASRKPAWIPDVAQDTNFPRAAFASRVG